jgi:hypothetical protein
MRCQSLKSIKDSCGFPPFSDANFLRNPPLLNHAVQPYFTGNEGEIQYKKSACPKALFS